MALPFIGTVLDIIKGPIDKLIPDKNKAAEMKHEIAMAITNTDMAQMEVNKVEAAHSSIFVAGWRPFVGWVCGVGLAMNFLILPIASWACAIWAPDIELPKLDIGELITLLMGMLGMGTLRTYEKGQNTNRNSI